MPKTSYYLDPNTGCRVIENGRFKRVSSEMSMAMHRIATQRGSVPGAAKVGSRLHTLQRQGPNILGQLKALAIEALNDGLGTDYPRFDVEAFREGTTSRPCLRLRVWDFGATEPGKVTIPF